MDSFERHSSEVLSEANTQHKFAKRAKAGGKEAYRAKKLAKHGTLEAYRAHKAQKARKERIRSRIIWSLTMVQCHNG